ncbi:MAG: hypothetical protein H8E84_00600 [Flavobacteriales bacterium]|nr:hypothetical protein [Flavobacteriales bacterium]
MLENNIKAYKMLAEIEISLREFLIKTFNKRFPTKEWVSDNSGKGPLSNQMIQSIKSTKSKTIKEWTGGKYIHELYFILFTDLSIILNMKQNKKLFPNLDQSKIEAISKNLEILFPIRNKIAHSRIINKRELSIVEGVYTIVTNALVDFDELIELQNHENILDIISNNLEKIENFHNITEFKTEIFKNTSHLITLEELDIDIEKLSHLIHSYMLTYSKSDSKIELRRFYNSNKNLIKEIKTKIYVII